MQQSNSLSQFDKWADWKENSFDLVLNAKGKTTPVHHRNTVTSTCLSLGLRPGEDFQVTMYQVRFKTKSYLAMFKINFNNG